VTSLIPGSKERPIDGVTGQFSMPWRRWLEAVNTALNAGGDDVLSLTAAIAAIATALGSPDGTVANIPDQESLDVVIVGRNGVTVTGKAGVTPVVVELPPMATSTIKARKSADDGMPEDCTVSEVLDFVPGTPAKGDLIVRDTAASARIPAGTAAYVLTSNGPGTLPTYQAPAGVAGKLVNYAKTVSTTTATTIDTSIPLDTTIPQITEGVAYSALDTTITPTSAGSLLEIEAQIPVSQSTNGTLRLALFRDSGANAITAGLCTVPSNGVAICTLRTVVAAGSVSATTFKVRWCTGGGTGNILMAGGVNYFGAAYQATMTIREIA